MAQQFTSLIKFRRGLKSQRLITKFQEGEPVFETDTYRFFLGVGENGTSFSTGGILSGNLTFIGPLTSNPDNTTEPRAYTGDIIFANNKLWRMSDSGWNDISTKVDNTTIIYNNSNQLAIKPGSFSISAGQGITVTDNTTVAITNTASNILQIVSNELTLPSNSLTGDYVKSSFFNSDQFLLAGTTWNLKLDNNCFETTDSVSIKGVPAGLKTDSLDISGVGTVNAAINQRFNDNNASKSGINLNNTNNNIQINPQLSVLNQETNDLVGLNLGFVDTIICSDDTNIFNGTILDTKQPWLGKQITTLTVYTDFTGISAVDDLNKTNLTSAGFAIFSNGISGKGKNYKKYALPLYALPDAPQVMYFSNTIGNTFMRGTNLLAGKFYYIENNTTTPIELASISTDPTTGLNTLSWNNVISFPVQAIIYLETISGITTIDLTNPPAIFSAERTSTGCLIKGFNFGSNQANITVAYDLLADEGTFINMTGVTLTSSSLNTQNITANKSPMPLASDIKGFQVTVTGQNPVYFEIN